MALFLPRFGRGGRKSVRTKLFDRKGGKMPRYRKELSIYFEHRLIDNALRHSRQVRYRVSRSERAANSGALPLLIALACILKAP